MKSNSWFILLPILLVSHDIISQLDRTTDFMVLHNWSGVGRDIELGVDQYLGHHIVHVGLSWFQNDALQGLTDHQRYFRTSEMSEKLGLNLGYKRSLHIPQSDIELLPKFEVQIFRMGTVYRMGNNYTFGKRQFSYNTSVGLDGKVRLYQNFFLVGGVEGGLLMRSLGGRYFPDVRDLVHQDLQLIANFSAGLLYRIRRGTD